MKTFLFFRGFVESRLLDIDWEEINRRTNTNIIPITYPTWTGTTYTPTWVVNPGHITYIPGYGTITTTPNYLGSGYITIPYVGSGTSTGFSLTTSNTNGTTTYTTGGISGTLTTGTGTYSSSSFKLQ
jgi:hypothetical protein